MPCPSSPVRRVLSYIYTDKLVLESAEEATHLLQAADHFGLHHLTTICAVRAPRPFKHESAAQSMLCPQTMF